MGHAVSGRPRLRRDFSHAKLAWPRGTLGFVIRFRHEMSSMKCRGILAVLAGTVAGILVLLRGPFAGVRDVAHEAVRFHLDLYGASIYEYHAATGQWPTRSDDLALTSMPAKSPYWRHTLDTEVYIVVWHKTLRPNPRENSDHILVYHNKGLIAEQGRSWVCWGDLRTEYIKTEKLQKYLKSLKD
jgi:hypothetical protein